MSSRLRCDLFPFLLYPLAVLRRVQWLLRHDIHSDIYFRLS
jgi:hypothetical protein